MKKTLQSYLEDKRDLFPLLDSLYRTEAFRPTRDEAGRFDFRFDGSRLTSHELLHVNALFAIAGRTIAACLDLYSLMRLVGEGPKVFRPTAEECFALEEVQVRIPVSAYSQPFPTFCVEFPSEYVEARRVNGAGMFGGTVSYCPVAQILVHVPEQSAIIGATLTDGEDGAVLCGLVGDPQSVVIEDDIMREMGDANTDPINANELATERRAIRVAMNACLLLMDRGFRKLPHSDEAERLSRLLRSKKTTNPGVLNATRTARRAIPTAYTIEQRVDVRRIIRGALSESEATGRTVSPHWRSAHWRMQPCGVGRKETRRVLIPHVMVNKSHFGGSNADTFVEQS